MSISVKNLTVSIDGTSSQMFYIKLEGKSWYMENFSLYQSLLTYNSLSFSMLAMCILIFGLEVAKSSAICC